MRAALAFVIALLLVPLAVDAAAGAWRTHADAPGAGNPLEPARDPAPYPLACAAPGEPATVLVYARPSDAPDRYAEMAPRIVAMAEKANGLLHEDAAAHGANVSLRARCGPDARPSVAREALAAPGDADTWEGIVDELRLRGYDEAHEKYAVWYEGRVGAFGGQGLWRDDDRPGAENANNVGGSFSIVYGVATGTTYVLWLHEHLHTMGAVQHSAPHSTGAWHCNDGRDVMCEVDAGPRSDYETVCSRLILDCNADDYFRPYPPEGSYLATHWNLASRANRWFAFGNEAPRAIVLDCAAEPLAPVRCAFVAQDDGGALAYLVEWGDGATTRVPEEGFAPAGEPQRAERRVAPGLRAVRVTAVDEQGERALASALVLSL